MQKVMCLAAIAPSTPFSAEVYTTRYVLPIDQIYRRWLKTCIAILFA
jgi:hypothetical protein